MIYKLFLQLALRTITSVNSIFPQKSKKYGDILILVRGSLLSCGDCSRMWKPQPTVIHSISEGITFISSLKILWFEKVLSSVALVCWEFFFNFQGDFQHKTMVSLCFFFVELIAIKDAAMKMKHFFFPWVTINYLSQWPQVIILQFIQPYYQWFPVL